MTTSYANLDRRDLATAAEEWFPQLVADAAWALGTTPEAILSTSRYADVAAARHVVAWVLREADLSLPAIGALLGRDHTTALNSVRRVEADARLLVLAWSLADRYARTQPITQEATA